MAVQIPIILKIDEMSFKEKKREVSTFSMTFNQPIDSEGQVTGIVRGGRITMRLKALNDGNSDLQNWMVDNSRACKGSILFYNTTNGVLMKTYEFEDAYCVDYEEHWEDDVYNPPLAHWEEITISCRKITNGPVNYSNEWNLVE